MGFRRPFRAAPVTLGPHYRRKEAARDRRRALSFYGAAALLGAVLGTASVAVTPEGRDRLFSMVKPLAVALGMARERPPQPGDSWLGCNAARAAGTAPIYVGEPGYREAMEGDLDGVACEPYR